MQAALNIQNQVSEIINRHIQFLKLISGIDPVGCQSLVESELDMYRMFDQVYRPLYKTIEMEVERFIKKAFHAHVDILDVKLVVEGIEKDKITFRDNENGMSVICYLQMIPSPHVDSFAGYILGSEGKVGSSFYVGGRYFPLKFK